MTNQPGGECEFCGRLLVLSTSNRNKGRPVKCLCRHRERMRQSGRAKRRAEGKPTRNRKHGAWHEERGVPDSKTNEMASEHWRQYSKEYYGAIPERRRDYFRKWAYGLEPGRYDEMLEEQDGKCFLCLRPMSRPHIDHNHKTGQVRHLLCGGCNMAVGIIEADIEWIDRVLMYLN